MSDPVSLDIAVTRAYARIEQLGQQAEERRRKPHEMVDPETGRRTGFIEQPYERREEVQMEGCRSCGSPPGLRRRYLNGVPTMLLCSCDASDKWVDDQQAFLTLPVGTFSAPELPQYRTPRAADGPTEVSADEVRIAQAAMHSESPPEGALDPQAAAQMRAWADEEFARAGEVLS